MTTPTRPAARILSDPSREWREQLVEMLQRAEGGHPRPFAGYLREHQAEGTA